MQKTMSRNRRQHKRGVTLRMAEYSVIPSSNNDVYDGIISDMSVLGMCLLTTNPLKCGEKIAFRSDNPTSKIAVVLWSDRGAFYYKVGLKFV
jgi:hypothetical protein